MTTTPRPITELGCLTLADLDDFRKAIGLRAVVVTEEDYLNDDDHDPVDPMVTMASLALEIGKATRAKTLTEARLRDWKAKQINDLLVSEPKLAEWKTRARIEAEPAWLATKDLLSEIDSVLITLQTFTEAVARR